MNRGFSRGFPFGSNSSGSGSPYYDGDDSYDTSCGGYSASYYQASPVDDYYGEAVINRPQIPSTPSEPEDNYARSPGSHYSADSPFYNQASPVDDFYGEAGINQPSTPFNDSYGEAVINRPYIPSTPSEPEEYFDDLSTGSPSSQYSGGSPSYNRASPMDDYYGEAVINRPYIPSTPSEPEEHFDDWSPGSPSSHYSEDSLSYHQASPVDDSYGEAVINRPYVPSTPSDSDNYSFLPCSPGFLYPRPPVNIDQDEELVDDVFYPSQEPVTSRGNYPICRTPRGPLRRHPPRNLFGTTPPSSRPFRDNLLQFTYSNKPYGTETQTRSFSEDDERWQLDSLDWDYEDAMRRIFKSSSSP